MTYTARFRAQVVAHTDAHTVAETADAFGVPVCTVLRWRHALTGVRRTGLGRWLAIRRHLADGPQTLDALYAACGAGVTWGAVQRCVYRATQRGEVIALPGPANVARQYTLTTPEPT